MPLPPNHPIKKLQRNSPTAMANAQAWNAPGGGYDKYKAGDAVREKALPIGGTVQPPAPGGGNMRIEPAPSQDRDDINWLRRSVRPTGRVT